MIFVESEFDRSSLKDNQYVRVEYQEFGSLDIYRFLSVFEEVQKVVRGVEIYLLPVIKYEASHVCYRLSDLTSLHVFILTNMFSPIFWFFQKRGTPAIGERYFQSIQNTWPLHLGEGW